MHANKNLVVGVFETLRGLDSALETLRGQGVRNSDISVLAPDAKAATHGFAGEPLGWINEAGELGTIGRNNTVVAGGPLHYALLETGGKNKENVSTALLGFGLPRFDADFYEICVRAGKSLLAVHVDSAETIDKARTTLVTNGAQSISVTKNSQESDEPEPFDNKPLFADDMREVI